MRIGYACLTVGVHELGAYRTCIVKNYRQELMAEIIRHNLKTLFSVLEYNVKNNIKMFRISSDIIPLASHPVNDFDWKKEFKQELTALGDYIKKEDLRVSMHPGQYTVLNSIKEDVVARAILDLNYHCDFLDSLNLDKRHKIILHVGGVYDDKAKAMQRFVDNFFTLSPAIQSRLVIENDDKLYNVEEVLSISKIIHIPVVFDNLHHQINKSDVHREVDWIEKCKATWKDEDGKCKLHYSNQNPNKRVGAHSEFIYIEEFLDFCHQIRAFDVDIMLEVKDKNLSAVKCINCTQTTSSNAYQQEWAKYKYVILEKDHNSYKELRGYFKNTEEFSPAHFYLLIEKALAMPNTLGGYHNGFDHVWGYFKKICTEKEKDIYKRKLQAFNQGKLQAQSMKNFLLKMAIKYNSKYLLESYYFAF